MAAGGQTVGVAAFMAVKENLFPRDMGLHMEKIQQELLRLEFPEVIQAREIQILWDSNLSREIMISLSDQKLKKQVKGGLRSDSADYREDSRYDTAESI